jgi:hypothetical protein
MFPIERIQFFIAKPERRVLTTDPAPSTPSLGGIFPINFKPPKLDKVRGC